MNYLLDTNIVVIYGRDNEMSRLIEKRHEIFDHKNNIAISIVTVGEINAFIKKMGLGDSRSKRMASIIKNSTVSGIHYDELIEAYGDIDHLSTGKIQVKVDSSRLSSRNMGKNDLWIAATAKVFDLTLVTTDKDFLFLKDEVIDVLYIDIDDFKSSLKK